MPKQKLNKKKIIIEKLIREIDSDERYHYPPATIFCNAPLALHQTAQESKMIILKKIINRNK